jgi:GDP-L-fucose synthase
MPSNLYGPGDNYHSENSHVIPALIRRFHEAKVSKQQEVIIWGTGKPRREFLYVDDMAQASVYIMNLKPEIYYKNTQPLLSHINVGSGEDISIQELAQLIATVIGYDGDILFDHSKPDGAMRKLMDSQLLGKFGWHAKIDLKEGLVIAYEDYLSRQI